MNVVVGLVVGSAMLLFGAGMVVSVGPMWRRTSRGFENIRGPLTPEALAWLRLRNLSLGVVLFVAGLVTFAVALDGAINNG